MNTSAVQVSHATVVVTVKLAKFITTFESLLGKYDPTVAHQIRNDPEAADRTLQAMDSQRNKSTLHRLSVAWARNASQDGPSVPEVRGL